MYFPAAGYGVDRHETSLLHQKCVSLGHWRCCTVCCGIRAELTAIPMAGKAARTCVRCKQLRHAIYFAHNADICKACRHHETFQYAACSLCRKPQLEREMRLRNTHEKVLVCYTCAPEAWSYECTVCHAWKSAHEFRAHRSDLMRKFHRRCKACENCEEFGKNFADFRMLKVDSRRCAKCAGAQKRYLCTICGKHQQDSDFPASRINHARESTRSLYLRCTMCHTCVSCKHH
jgi:hypothetical protein